MVRPSLRYAVFERDKFTCQYCGRKSPNVKLEADHVHPKSAGGEDILENLITSCSECNIGKYDHVPIEVSVQTELNYFAVLTRIEAARFLRISLRKLDYLCAAREIPHMRLGKRGVRFSKRALDNFMHLKIKESGGWGGH